METVIYEVALLLFTWLPLIFHKYMICQDTVMNGMVWWCLYLAYKTYHPFTSQRNIQVEIFKKNASINITLLPHFLTMPHHTCNVVCSNYEMIKYLKLYFSVNYQAVPGHVYIFSKGLQLQQLRFINNFHSHQARSQTRQDFGVLKPFFNHSLSQLFETTGYSEQGGGFYVLASGPLQPLPPRPHRASC